MSNPTYIVTTPRGFTSSFDVRTIETLVRLGLIKHERDGYLLTNGRDQDIDAPYKFYVGAA